jgi:PAS domain S-box-containing protein
MTADTGLGGRLLLADDDERNRDMLSQGLTRHGYQVATVTGGRQALAALERERFDLLLLDVMMPDMSGLDVLEELRHRDAAGQPPVILVTARTQTEDMVTGLTLGASDYVIKPVDLRVLLARIRTQLARCRAEQALRESEERFALAIQGTNDGVWDWKVPSGEVFYSPRWQSILGYDGDCPPTLEAWLARIHPDDAARVSAELDHHLRGGSAHLESEHRVRLGSGGHRWVLARGLAVRDRHGTAVRMAGSLTDITEGKVADALTGMPNRALFVDRVDRLLDYSRRVPEFQIAVLFVDLDRFKNINDSMGHAAGDDLLVQASRRLEQMVRTGDTVARFGPAIERGHQRVAGHAVARLGGDEFAVLVSGVSQPEDAMRVAERIVQAFSDPFDVEGQAVFVTTSIGIALSASGYRRAEDMLRDADIALYRAKTGGRSRYALFDVRMREQIMDRVQLESDMRRAIERHELVLQYQPILSLADRKVRGFEALLRWRHPSRGMLPPCDFSPLAEETGTVVSMGYWVLGEVCRQLSEWAAAGVAIDELVIAINLSSRHLLVPDIVERLAGIVTEHGINPAIIELELTETSVMTNPEAARTVFERLKAFGFRLAIDDFGTGYSSLSYLQRFRVDRLKIDRSFLTNSEAPTETGIIRTIVDLARNLQMEVVAEGVERPSQLDQLTAMQCDFGQGFLFSRPVDPDPLEQLLLDGSPLAPLSAAS